MQVDKCGVQVLQYVECYWCIVDKCLGFVGRGDFLLDDYLWVKVQVMFIKEVLQVVGFYIEEVFDGVFSVQVVERFDVCMLAYNQAQCVQQNGFVGFGFISNNGEFF